MSTPPSPDEIHQAIARPAQARRALYREDPQFANASNLAERVDGVRGTAEPGTLD